MNESEKQCHRKHIHGAHRWFEDREMWQCYGVDAESEVMKWWTGDKSYALSDPAWPTFEVQVVVNTDTSSHLLLACLNCGWEKKFSWPVLWSVLSTKVSRHGMTHIEESEIE